MKNKLKIILATIITFILIIIVFIFLKTSNHKRLQYEMSED